MPLSWANALADILAELLPDRVTISLNGTLGAGKTYLVQAIAAASGIPAQNVTSPTLDSSIGVRRS